MQNLFWSNYNRRMHACKLELHPEKTKMVYCRDYRRRGKHPDVKFDFLGYSFQPRTTKSKRTGKLFLGFDCAISISSRKKIADKLGDKEMEFFSLSFKSIVGIARSSTHSFVDGSTTMANSGVMNYPECSIYFVSASAMGKETVQTLQDEFNQSL